MLLKTTIQPLLQILISILATVNSQERTTSSAYLLFKIGDNIIYFDKGNATQFLSCICNDVLTCTPQATQNKNRFDVFNTLDEATKANGSMGPYQCSLNLRNESYGNIFCFKTTSQNLYNPSLTPLKQSGCIHSFKATCDSHNASLTWMECNYSVMCLANGTTYLNETYNHPGLNGNKPQNCENIANLDTSSAMPTESTTKNNKQLGPSSNSDSNLPLIIGISVSVGALLLIVFIAATILLFRRRKRQAKIKTASLQHRPDSGTVKTTDHYDTCSTSETPRVIEPYSVVTLNEYTTKEDVSNSRKPNVISDANTNLNKELYSKADTLPNVVSEKEHIYFELEPESVTNNHQEDHIHH